MDFLPPNHFLALSRPDAFNALSAGIPDTSTLAAHDYDVDTRTGFMPPEPPLARLPAQWEEWEALLDSAFSPHRLRHANTPDLSDDDRANSERWRACMRAVCAYLPTYSRFVRIDVTCSFH